MKIDSRMSCEECTSKFLSAYSKVPNKRPDRVFRTFCYFKRERQYRLFLFEYQNVLNKQTGRLLGTLEYEFL